MKSLRIAAFLVVAAAGPAMASGGLDINFGDNGLTLIDGQLIRAPGNNFATGLHVAASGEIVVAGTISGGAAPTWTSLVLARLTPSGQLDASFGNAGFATVGGTADRAFALAAHGDGYLVGGESDGRFAVWRVDAGGNADAEFGDGGSGAKILGEGFVSMLAPLASGNILVAGWSPDGHYESGGFSLVRLTPSGSVDASFGYGGFLIPADARIDEVGPLDSMVVTADEDLVFAGGAGPKLVVFRLRPDGALDETFGDGGIADFVFGAENELVFANDTRVLEDGKLIVSGFVGPDPWFLWSGRGFVARLNADGSADVGFAGAGIFQTDPEDVSEFAATADGPEGTVYAVGTRTTDPDGGNWTGENMVMALDADGVPVENFGNRGLLSVGTLWDPRIDYEVAVDIAAHPDDGMVVLGDGWDVDRRISVARIGSGDYPGVVGFRSDGESVSQQADIVEVELHRWGGTSGDVTAGISVAANSSASAATDFSLLDDSVHWADGESGARSVRVQVIDDGQGDEPPEMIVLDLSIASGQATAGMTTYVLTLQADPASPVMIGPAPRGGGAMSLALAALLLLIRLASESLTRRARR